MMAVVYVAVEGQMEWNGAHGLVLLVALEMGMKKSVEMESGPSGGDGGLLC